VDPESVWMFWIREFFCPAELRGPFRALTVILEYNALILLKKTRQALCT
jgi:hypothetical protein